MDLNEAKNTYAIQCWKDCLLKEKLENDFHKKPDDMRNVLVQIQNCRVSDQSNHICSSKLYLDEFEKYAEIIDSPQDQGGLDNYAESILNIVQGKRSESAEWKSSLSLEKLDKESFFQHYKNVSKIAKDLLLPSGKESMPLSTIIRDNKTNPAKLNSTDQDKVTNQIQPNSNKINSTHNNPYSESSETLSRINSTFNPNSCKNEFGLPQLPSMTTAVSSKPLNNGNTNTLFSAASNTGSLFQQVNSNSHSRQQNPTQSSAASEFWNVGSAAGTSSNFRPYQSSANDYTQGHGNFKNNFAKGEYGARRNEPQPPYKRSRDAEEEYMEDEDDNNPVNCRMFKTARQQLDLDNQKKYRNNNPGAVNNSTYGTSKKSLGTRRGLNSKFVPPIMNREDSNNGGGAGTLIKKCGPNKSGGAYGNNQGQEDGEIDERLKNIDPKMVELIMSEIMDQGQPLTWDDIAGLEFAKKTIQEIVVWPMLRPDIFTGLRGPPKGLLLFGPPGTGKTLIGKCIASQSKSTFFSISASSLTSKWIGDGEKMVRALFAVARVHQPAVVFIDEIDSLLSQRSDTEHESSRRIKTEFLVQLDGATTGESDRILIVGATNRPQEIDEAARRRFVKRLYIPLPEAVARKQIIINLMTQQKHHLDEDQLSALVDKTDGYSGADMANLCREAALGPIRSIPFTDIQNISADQVPPITFKDFEEALQQVRASVSDKDLDLYITWNKQYGSWGR